MRDFYGGFATMDRSHGVIGDLWEQDRYLIDTHTAVAYRVYLDYLAKTGDETPTVVASTASAYKFAGRVAEAIGIGAAADEFACIRGLNEATGVPVPEGLRDLDGKAVRHDMTVDKDDMRDAVASCLGMR
jgi:threonine synthase